MSSSEGGQKEVEGLGEDFPELVTGEQWVQHFWDKDFLPWEDGLEPDSLLLKYFDSKGAQGRKGLHVFFPMCGVSPDMKWAAEQGHKVVGCEYAQKAGSLFAKNMKLSYTESPAPRVEGILFKYNEFDLKIYACDIFKFNNDVEGTFDIIWDSGAMVAVNPEDRKRYADAMKSLMKPDGKLFIYGIDGDPGTRTGPPQPINDHTMEECFGDFNVELVDKKKESREFEGVVHTSIDSLRLLTLK